MERLDEELKQLPLVLQRNGYMMRNIRRAFKRAQDFVIRNQHNEIESLKKVVIPYIQGTLDKITKVLRRKQIRTTFYPPNFLRNMLNRAKDPIDPMFRKGICSIPYSCGKMYIKGTSLLVKF